MKIKKKSFLSVITILTTYTLLSLSFSLFGFLNPVEPSSIGQTAILKEVTMHILFGFIIGIFTFNKRYIIYASLFPILLDADHTFSLLGFYAYGRMAHSLTFIILSALLMGKLFSSKGFNIKLASIIVVTLLSHIAFDALDENPTNIALLAPFSFSEIAFPFWTSPLLEVLGIIIVIFVFKKNILIEFRNRIFNKVAK